MLLEVQNLRMYLHLRRGLLRAVDGVSLRVAEGETLGLVGESGSGKTLTGLSLLRLLPKGSGQIESGSSIKLDGKELTSLPEKELARDIRGRRIAMITQDPMTSLNPVFSIGDQVGAPLRNHGVARGAKLRSAIIDVLRRVRIPSPDDRLGDYPHQFSGGQRQRVVAGMAIGCAPRLLLADEPTTALDVTIQVQIIALLRRIQRDSGVGIILITHDLGVAASLCHRIAVMYAGQIVETGPVREIYRRPSHPYTRALLAAIPILGERKRRLTAIPGQPPSLIEPPEGCRFAARCPHRMDQCAIPPPQISVGEAHTVACWKPAH